MYFQIELNETEEQDNFILVWAWGWIKTEMKGMRNSEDQWGSILFEYKRYTTIFGTPNYQDLNACNMDYDNNYSILLLLLQKIRINKWNSRTSGEALCGFDYLLSRVTACRELEKLYRRYIIFPLNLSIFMPIMQLLKEFYASRFFKFSKWDRSMTSTSNRCKKNIIYIKHIIRYDHTNFLVAIARSRPSTKLIASFRLLYFVNLISLYLSLSLRTTWV